MQAESGDSHLVNLLSLVLNMVYETRDRLGPVGMQCRFMQPAQQEEGLTHAALCGVAGAACLVGPAHVPTQHSHHPAVHTLQASRASLHRPLQRRMKSAH